jgi:hypothetical protein
MELGRMPVRRVLLVDAERPILLVYQDDVGHEVPRTPSLAHSNWRDPVRRARTIIERSSA